MRIVRAILTVGSFTAISRFFGLIREILLSHILGANGITDAFFVAFKFPNFFRRLFAEGAFNAAFVPLFSRQLASDGKDNARETAEQVFSVLTVVLLVFVVMVMLFTPTIVHLLAPGFSCTPERLDMTVTFVRITFPYILFISLSAHLSGVLNSLDRFAAAAGVPILLNIVMIFSLLIMPQMPDFNPGILLSTSVFISGVLQFSWLYIACARIGFRIRWKWPKLTSQVKTLVRLMGPGMIGAGVMNINFFIDTIIASYLPEKSVSYLYYADRLNQLPLSIFGIAIGTALLPSLSRQLRGGEFDKALKSQSLAVEFSLQMAVPAAIGLIVLAYPIINTIYGLSSEDVLATANALAAFSIGIPAYVLTKVFSASFFARQDTKTPVITGCICIVTNVILTLMLMGPFQHVGMALATSCSAWLNVVLLYGVLHARSWYFLSKTIGIILIKVLGSCFVMSVSVLLIEQLFSQNGAPVHLMGKVFYLLSITGIGVGVFVVAGYSLGTFNLEMMREALRKN